MTDQKQLALLKRGVKTWNKWRQDHPDIQPDLSDANLNGMDLDTINFSRANLTDANLSLANLRRTNFSAADLTRAKLIGASLNHAHLTRTCLHRADLRWTDLKGTDFNHADLTDANLTGAILSQANLLETNLSGANFYQVILSSTTFGNVNLATVKGLETVVHAKYSYIDLHTLYRSQGKIPLVFLRGTGMSEPFISGTQDLIKATDPIHYHTCFISYSSKDQAFVEQLHADLQSTGVRCWFAPQDMRPGDIIWNQIDESIRLFDKLLLVLSAHSVESIWVEQEVQMALAKERSSKSPVLFPIRIDEAIVEIKTGWPAHFRETRHIADFTHWQNPQTYQLSLDRLLHNLTVAPPST